MSISQDPVDDSVYALKFLSPVRMLGSANSVLLSCILGIILRVDDFMEIGMTLPELFVASVNHPSFFVVLSAVGVI